MNMSYKTSLGALLSITGIMIILVGIIRGLSLLSGSESEQSLGALIFAGSIISGMIMMAIAKIIDLLQNIKDNGSESNEFLRDMCRILVMSDTYKRDESEDEDNEV